MVLLNGFLCLVGIKCPRTLSTMGVGPRTLNMMGVSPRMLSMITIIFSVIIKASYNAQLDNNYF